MALAPAFDPQLHNIGVCRRSAARPKGFPTEEIGARREGLAVARDIRPNAARLGVLNDCISCQTKLCCKEKNWYV